ncbi:MAG: tetratricopeptide repeat protein, partial [Beijerinckiaceae bacterium]
TAAQAVPQPVPAKSLLPVIEPAESAEGNFLAAVVAGAQRDTSSAAAYLREALRADPRNTELIERSFEAQLAGGNIEEAARLARQMLNRERNNSLARLTLAVDALRTRQYAQARERLSIGARSRAAEVTATLLTAWAHQGSGQTAKAIEVAERLKGEQVLVVFRDYAIGLIAEVAGKPEIAEKRLRTAYETVNGASSRIVEALARFEARRGKKDEALRIITMFEERAGQSPALRALRSDIDAGKPITPIVANVQEGAADLMTVLAGEGTRTGDEMAGIVYLRLALHLDPKNDMALISLADIYERLKRYEHANVLYERLPPASPFAPAAEVQAGLNYETLGQTDEAIRRLSATVERRPDDVDAISALANVYRVQKKYQEAVETYSKAITKVDKPERRHWQLFYFRGAAYERLKQWDKGEVDMKRALELFPDQPDVLNYLGYTWVDLKLNIEKGFELLRRAVELAPRNGYIVDSLGWAHYRLGNYEDAVRELERAVNLRPADPTINDHLGDAYWKVGRKLEATFQWNHARDLKPEPDELEKILAKIANGLVEEENPSEASLKDKLDMPALPPTPPLSPDLVSPQKNGG